MLFVDILVQYYGQNSRSNAVSHPNSRKLEDYDGRIRNRYVFPQSLPFSHQFNHIIPCSSWTTVMYYNAWANNALIDGKKIKFTGNAGSFFMVWLKTLLLSLLTLGLYWIFVGKKNTARWVDSNLAWA